MQGMIKTYLPEKNYGFIQGTDKKDYFFHTNNLLDKKQSNLLAEGVYVDFEQKATPKGYVAEKLIIDSNTKINYITPSKIYISKESSIKGWEIIEYSGWQIQETLGKCSTDEVMDLLKKRAKSLGCNAIIGVKYKKGTDSELSSSGRGRYHFSTHTYYGMPVIIAKKSSTEGKSLEELKSNLYENCSTLKKELIKKSKKSKINTIFLKTILFFGIITICTLVNISLILIGVILAFYSLTLFKSKNYDNWLIELKRGKEISMMRKNSK